MDPNHQELIPTQQSLLSRLRDWDDQASWQKFFDTYWRLIYSVARQFGFNDEDAQDVVQETVISVARSIPKFQYNPALGSFKSWLLQITRRRMLDQLRKKQIRRGNVHQPREERLRTSMLEGQADTNVVDLEELWEQGWRKHLLETALERLKTKVSPKHYQIFHLHLHREMSARSIAQRLDVKLTDVYYAQYKLSRLLHKEIKALEKKPAGPTNSP